MHRRRRCLLPDDYQLLDFGDGRRLERFGEIVLDRPCPAAEAFQRADPDRLEAGRRPLRGTRRGARGNGPIDANCPSDGSSRYGPLRFELKRTDFGHLGCFPNRRRTGIGLREHCPLSLWERVRVRASARTAIHVRSPHPLPLSQRERGVTLKVLNLFAYTGGSTLAAAAAGAEVVHVDAAKNIVAWARRNAELSGLADAPIRWIAEDAMKFVKRELKRGNRYDAVILDPPSYGHGPRGEVWRLSKHLPRLLSLCGELTAGRPQFMLLTCHTPGYDAEALGRMMLEALRRRGDVSGGPLTIRAAAGRELPSGVCVRWRKRAVRDAMRRLRVATRKFPILISDPNPCCMPSSPACKIRE